MQLPVNRIKIITLILLLIVTALACAQSGDIVSEAEATRLVLPTETPQLDLSDQAEYQVGETATAFGGKEFGALVPLYGDPGGRFFTSQILTNDLVVILGLGLSEDGVIWYRVQGNAGTGWILSDNLKPAAVDLSVE